MKAGRTTHTVAILRKICHTNLQAWHIRSCPKMKCSLFLCTAILQCTPKTCFFNKIIASLRLEGSHKGHRVPLPAPHCCPEINHTLKASPSRSLDPARLICGTFMSVEHWESVSAQPPEDHHSQPPWFRLSSELCGDQGIISKHNTLNTPGRTGGKTNHEGDPCTLIAVQCLCRHLISVRSEFGQLENDHLPSWAPSSSPSQCFRVVTQSHLSKSCQNGFWNRQ